MEKLKALESPRQKLPLTETVGALPPVPPGLSANEETLFLKELIESGDQLTAAEISCLLNAEQQAQKRPAILVMLRHLYKNTVLPDNEKKRMTAEAVERKVLLAQQRSRRNFVRRVYEKNKLFAMEEIRAKYPEYAEAQLAADLQEKPGKAKRKKQKPIVDLRRCQLQKLAAKLTLTEQDPANYHRLCNQIVLLQNAHDRRLPIPLTVKLQGETLVYDFKWQTRESAVKNFVALANQNGMTHPQLQKIYQEILRSPVSY